MSQKQVVRFKIDLPLELYEKLMAVLELPGAPTIDEFFTYGVMKALSDLLEKKSITPSATAKLIAGLMKLYLHGAYSPQAYDFLLDTNPQHPEVAAQLKEECLTMRRKKVPT